jgi:hypothetical protein
MSRGEEQIQVSGIYVWGGKAYLPAQAQYESGIYVDVEPVYIIDIQADTLKQAIQNVKVARHARIPDPKSREEFLERKSPILSATGARNWKQLAKSGACYDISWSEKEVRINMSRLDKKGRWEYDPSKVRILPPDTSLEEIVEIILDDLKTRPGVFN